MEEMTQKSANMCKCSHHITTPILVVVFGLLFFLKAIDVVAAQTVAVAWPILVVIAGIMKMCEARCKCC